ncbi:ATP-binding protein [Marinicrinis sediminis]|uniref:histidine kinase n=1 Tax=Marinicrinis sediminis TaxID=1652465 RepID=A0ABW5R6C7_9BACL
MMKTSTKLKSRSAYPHTYTAKSFIQHLLIFLLFLSILLLIRWAWNEFNATPDHPQAVQGVVDFRGWNFEDSRSITLHGEWEFFPQALLTPDHFDASGSSGQLSADTKYVQVPGNWGNPSNRVEQPAYGYGTYRLRILVDPSLDQPYALWIHRINFASMVFLNDQQELPFGLPAEDKNRYRPKAKSYTANYDANGAEEIVLLIQVANYENPWEGGIVGPVHFGSQAAVDTEYMYNIGIQFVVFIVLVLHALYAVLLFVFSGKQKTIIPLFFMFLFAAIFVISDHDHLLLLWLSLAYKWDLKIRLLTYMWLSFSAMQLIRTLSAQSGNNKGFSIFTALLGCYSVFIVCTPAYFNYHTYSTVLFLLFYLLPVAWSFVLIFGMVRRKQKDAFYILFAGTAILSSALGGILFLGNPFDTRFYPVDILASVVGFSAYCFKIFFRNARERDELNERLRDSDKRKDQFLANTSHELRTPLHGIMNIARSLARQDGGRSNGIEVRDLELLIKLSSRMSHMLDDLLDAARLKDGHIKLNRAPLLMQSVVPGVIEMLDFLVRGRSVRLEMNISKDAPAVWADEKRVIQIVYNLLHNAIKFTERGTIRIIAERRMKHLAVHIIDTGMGMDKLTLSRIFNPYEQGSAQFDSGSGVGLGLSICKQLVELHGGELTATSVPGKGSTFTLQLPLADAAHSQETVVPLLTNRMATYPWERPEHAASVESTDDPPYAESSEYVSSFRPKLSMNMNGQTNILAVDDDPVNLNVLTTILSDDAYHLRTATSASEALAMLDEERWDLIITDVMMPGISGYELTKRVRERFSLSELPILLLTARSQLTDTFTGFSCGANDYVTKPVDALELQYRIWSLTMLKQSVDESLRIEAASLQAQIEPHFLFNALNSILALSTLDIERMHKLGEAFTAYLRISYQFVNSRKLVLLSQELELVQAYLYIEKERFEDRLSIIWEGERNLHVTIPPLTIQPLVENAVKHGVVNRASGGTVTIRIVHEVDHVRIEIKDDGFGMDAAMVKECIQPPTDNRAGIGLYNTNRRLKQIYGQGLLITSQSGEGTTVSFSIPV